MSRTSAVVALALLALLAVAAVVGTAGAVASDGHLTDEKDGTLDGAPADLTPLSNTTNYLSIGEMDRQTYLRGDVDVAAAAGMSAQRLHASHDDRVFDRRLESADSGRLALVRDRADRAAVQLRDLDARYDLLLSEYNNGTISDEAFLRRTARLSAQARTVNDHLQHVATSAEESADVSIPVALSTRLSDLQTRLVTLPDPIKQRIETGLAGGDPAVLYAGGSDDGLVLAAVEGDEFTRTATLRGAYAPDRPDQFEADEGRSAVLALQRGGELYPWAYDNAIGTPQVRGFGNTDVYLIRVDHPRGSLATYISGGTRDVFHEIQTQRADQLPVTSTANGANDNLNVTVGTTSPTGPMRVSLIQPSTGAPLDGTVRIDGETVGQTGSDGQLYTVQPTGQFRVNATAGTDSVTVSVSSA